MQAARNRYWDSSGQRSGGRARNCSWRQLRTVSSESAASLRRGVLLFLIQPVSRQRQREWGRKEETRTAMARLAKVVVGDTALSFLWVFSMASLGLWTGLIATTLNWTGSRTPIIFTLVSVIIFTFSLLGKALGGAGWNPTTPVAFYSVGASPDSLTSLAVRLPAMAAGGALGALSIMEVMPESYKYTLGGPRLKVDLHTGALAEGVLTFIITLVVLATVLNGPKNGIVKTFIIIATTLLLVTLGIPYTGPAMNPANAFGWAYVNKKHTSQEHFYVYWITPFIGTLAASGVYKLLFRPPGRPAPKEEKTQKTE